MLVKTNFTTSIDKTLDNIKSVANDITVNSIIVFCCDQDEGIVDALDEVLPSIDKVITGGIFPGIIANAKSYYNGSVVLGLTQDAKQLILKDIDTSLDGIGDLLEEFSSSMTSDKTLLTFFDGLSPNIEGVKELIFEHLSVPCNLFGGGAGSLSFESKPCLITNKGVLNNAYTLTHINASSGIGVAHGWIRASDALKVTKSHKNKLIEINWRPAFDVYKESIYAVSNKAISKENFFDIAKSHPFGIAKLNKEMIVRDPLSTQDGEIVCVGEIPQSSFVYVLRGDEQGLIDGAGKAKTLALESYPKETGSELCIIIDCISRALFLGDNITKELEKIGANAFGALTLGEIASQGTDYLEIYNKTSVVGIMEG